MKQRFFPILTCLALLTLSACGGGTTFLPSNNPTLDTSQSETAVELEILLSGDNQVLTILEGVHPGDVIFLEVQNVDANAKATWSTSNISLGFFLEPGELHIQNVGTFEVRVYAGGKRVTVTVVVTPGTSLPEVEDTKEQNQELPPPSHPTEPPSEEVEDPIPPAVNSDAFMDEIIAFNPGADAGFGQGGLPNIVLGPPQGFGELSGSTHVLSLGKGGEIILKSDTPILNGAGDDFIVFENAFYINGNFDNPFAELAEISVSQDGVTFYSFICEEGTGDDPYPGCAGLNPVLANSQTNNIDPTDPWVAGGEAFDLEEVGLSWVQYIKIKDLNFALPNGGFSVSPKAGFDLDAIAIIYQ